MPAPTTTRAFRSQHPTREALLEWFRDRNFEENVVLSFCPRRTSPVPYFKKIYNAVIEFGRTIYETVPYGAVVAPSFMVPTRQVGWPHAHLALQDPLEHEEEFLRIATKYRLGARFDRGPGLLAQVCDHMDRLDGAHFFPFFEPCAHLRGPARAGEKPRRAKNFRQNEASERATSTNSMPSLQEVEGLWPDTAAMLRPLAREQSRIQGEGPAKAGGHFDTARIGALRDRARIEQILKERCGRSHGGCAAQKPNL